MDAIRTPVMDKGEAEGILRAQRLGKLEELFNSAIPNARRDISQGATNLNTLADYCEGLYEQANTTKERTAAIDTSKQYCIHSLASVAYQINNLALHARELFDLQNAEVSDLAGQVNYLQMATDIHKEKVARRVVGEVTVMRFANKLEVMTVPTTPPVPPPYSRCRISLSDLAAIGCGSKGSEDRIMLSKPGNMSGFTGRSSFRHSRKFLAGQRKCLSAEPIPVAGPVSPRSSRALGIDSEGMVSNVDSIDSDALNSLEQAFVSANAAPIGVFRQDSKTKFAHQTLSPRLSTATIANLTGRPDTATVHSHQPSSGSGYNTANTSNTSRPSSTNRGTVSPTSPSENIPTIAGTRLPALPDTTPTVSGRTANGAVYEIQPYFTFHSKDAVAPNSGAESPSAPKEQAGGVLSSPLKRRPLSIRLSGTSSTGSPTPDRPSSSRSTAKPARTPSSMGQAPAAQSGPPASLSASQRPSQPPPKPPKEASKTPVVLNYDLLHSPTHPPRGAGANQIQTVALDNPPSPTGGVSDHGHDPDKNYDSLKDMQANASKLCFSRSEVDLEPDQLLVSGEELYAQTTRPNSERTGPVLPAPDRRASLFSVFTPELAENSDYEDPGVLAKQLEDAKLTQLVEAHRTKQNKAEVEDIATYDVYDSHNNSPMPASVMLEEAPVEMLYDECTPRGIRTSSGSSTDLDSRHTRVSQMAPGVDNAGSGPTAAPVSPVKKALGPQFSAPPPASVRSEEAPVEMLYQECTPSRDVNSSSSSSTDLDSCHTTVSQMVPGVDNSASGPTAAQVSPVKTDALGPRFSAPPPASMGSEEAPVEMLYDECTPSHDVRTLSGSSTDLDSRHTRVSQMAPGVDNAGSGPTAAPVSPVKKALGPQFSAPPPASVRSEEAPVEMLYQECTPSRDVNSSSSSSTDLDSRHTPVSQMVPGVDNSASGPTAAAVSPVKKALGPQFSVPPPPRSRPPSKESPGRVRPDVMPRKPAYPRPDRKPATSVRASKTVAAAMKPVRSPCSATGKSNVYLSTQANTSAGDNAGNELDQVFNRRRSNGSIRKAQTTRTESVDIKPDQDAPDPVPTYLLTRKSRSPLVEKRQQPVLPAEHGGSRRRERPIPIPRVASPRSSPAGTSELLNSPCVSPNSRYSKVCRSKPPSPSPSPSPLPTTFSHDSQSSHLAESTSKYAAPSTLRKAPSPLQSSGC